jgi:uncharacterized protein (DUF608 family)
MKHENISAESDWKLFPTDLPSSQWVQFEAEGFSKPVCGVIYRFDQPATNGLALGAIDTGCLDLETSGLWGYCTIFNSHVPRRGPLNLPFLGLSVDRQTWVLSSTRTKQYDTTDSRKPDEPGLFELTLEGVNIAKEIHYWGHYPVADLEYETDAPVSVGLRAWASFLPGDIQNSLIPGVVFGIHLRNTSDDAKCGTVAFSFPGPTEAEAGTNIFARREVTADSFRGVEVTTEKASYVLGMVGEEELRLGGELGADGAAWANMANSLPVAKPGQPGTSIAVRFDLKPNEAKVVRFLLTWYSPQWKGGGHPSSTEGNIFAHIYAVHYGSALEAARILASQHQSLLKRVLAWQEVLYTDEKIPGWLADSLINALYMITEDGMWAAAKPPLPDWVRPEDGLFGMNECPRGCPQIECLPCSFYGNIPLVYFFPTLALSTLRGYKGYQYPEGAPPWIFGGVTGNTPPVDFAMPTRGYQFALNGVCYVDMLSKYWLVRGDEEMLREFYPSVKNATIWQMNLRPEYSIGDRVISMPAGNAGTEWFEAPEPGWAGMATHLGGLHLAHMKIVEQMAEKVNDPGFAQVCREWFQAGSHSMETKMWIGNYYLNFWEPETGTKSDLVFGYQLDGEWMARFHGLEEGVFRTDRVKTTLETIKQINVALSKSGAVNYANPDGTPAQVGGYGTYSYFPNQVLMLAMTYMYEGQVDFGLELARCCWENMICKWRYTWDMPNIMRGDEDTGERTYGHDYYQTMMIWSLPAAMEGKGLSAPTNPGGLVDRVIKAACQE